MPVPAAGTPFEVVRGSCGEGGQYRLTVTVDVDGFVEEIVAVNDCPRRSFDVVITAGGVTRWLPAPPGATMTMVRSRLEALLGGPVRWGVAGVSIGARR